VDPALSTSPSSVPLQSSHSLVPFEITPAEYILLPSLFKDHAS
jgi:hypothetical protein